MGAPLRRTEVAADGGRSSRARCSLTPRFRQPRHVDAVEREARGPSAPPGRTGAGGAAAQLFFGSGSPGRAPSPAWSGRGVQAMDAISRLHRRSPAWTPWPALPEGRSSLGVASGRRDRLDQPRWATTSPGLPGAPRRDGVLGAGHIYAACSSMSVGLWLRRRRRPRPQRRAPRRRRGLRVARGSHGPVRRPSRREQARHGGLALAHGRGARQMSQLARAMLGPTARPTSTRPSRGRHRLDGGHAQGDVRSTPEGRGRLHGFADQAGVTTGDIGTSNLQPAEQRDQGPRVGHQRHPDRGHNRPHAGGIGAHQGAQATTRRLRRDGRQGVPLRLWASFAPQVDLSRSTSPGATSGMPSPQARWSRRSLAGLFYRRVRAAAQVTDGALRHSTGPSTSSAPSCSPSRAGSSARRHAMAGAG